MQRAQRYYREIQDARNEWASGFPVCWLCGDEGYFPPLQVHEIERRSHAPRTWASECNYLRACLTCHEGPLATMPHAEQLAYKLVWDPWNFDLEGWLRLADPELRAPERITLADVVGHLEVAR